MNLILLIGVVTCLLPFIDGEYIALIFTLPGAILLMWMWVATGYEVTDEQLSLRCGPFKKSISIKDINKIRPTNNLLASFALSLDRLEITYGGKYAMVLVSPKDKEGFITALKSINPEIKLDN